MNEVKDDEIPRLIEGQHANLAGTAENESNSARMERSKLEESIAKQE